MPVPSGQMINDNAARITFVDFAGGRIPQRVRTSGGGVNTDADKDLAEAIAAVSNASLAEYGKDEKNKWRESDFIFHDDAHSNGEKQLVLTFVHDTDPEKTREVIIPAPKRSLFEDDEVTPKWSDTALQLVVSKAEDLINDDGSGLNPGDFHTVRGRLTTRKISGRRAAVANLPNPIEP